MVKDPPVKDLLPYFMSAEVSKINAWFEMPTQPPLLQCASPISIVVTMEQLPKGRSWSPEI